MLNRKKKILSICLDAIFLAIIILMTFTNIGFIPLGAISVTIIHVPVLIGAYLFGRKKGLLYGLFFGLMSFIKALQSPMSILDPFFQNPLVSILPRTLFGYIAGFVFEFIKKNFKKQIISQGIILITSFLLTLLHSVMVLGILGLLYSSKLDELLTGYYASYWVFMGITLGSSSLLEGLCGAIITPVVSYPLKRFVLSSYITSLEHEQKPTPIKEEKISTEIVSILDNECTFRIRIKK